jgi:hypothetical protein
MPTPPSAIGLTYLTSDGSTNSVTVPARKTTAEKTGPPGASQSRRGRAAIGHNIRLSVEMIAR